MAASVVGSVELDVTGTGGTGFTTPSRTTTAGNAVAVFIMTGSGNSVTSVTDNKTGNTYTSQKNNDWLYPGGGGDDQRAHIFTCDALSGAGAGHTWTVNFGGATPFFTAVVIEIAGQAATTPFDFATFDYTQDSATPFTQTTTARTQADNLILTMLGPIATGTSVFAATYGGSAMTSVNGQGSNTTWAMGVLSFNATSAASVSIVGSDGVSSAMSLSTVAVKSAAAGGGIVGAGQISSAQALGAPVIGAAIAPAAVASAEAIGAVAIAAGIAPVGVASAQALGQPVVAANIGTTGVASAQGVGAPIVGTPAGVNAVGIASAEVFGQPTLAAAIAVTGVATGEALGTPTVAAAISPAGIASAEAFGFPVVAPAGVFALGIPSDEAVGPPALAAVINAAGILSQEAIGQPLVGAAPPPPATTFPGFEVDQKRRRLPEVHRVPVLQRALEKRLRNVKPANDRAAARAKAIEFKAAALVLDGATARDIAPLLQAWEMQRPYIPPPLAALPTLDVFLSQIGFRIEQAQAVKATTTAADKARRQDEDALLALMLA
jgi:hypothetical protein